MWKKIDKDAFLSIEESFFKLDQENKIGTVELSYENPEEIFDPNLRSLTPRFSADFSEQLISLFDFIPSRCSLEIRVLFDDLGGYSEEQLTEIWKKNLLLEARIRLRETKAQNKLALGLCLLGLVFILTSILIGRLWTEESVLREIVAYILDIVATVPFWGAMDIYFIENRERRKRTHAIIKRFHAITFRQKEDFYQG